MSRCKHDKNWVLTERVRSASEYSAENGVIDTEGWSDGSGSGIYRFRCGDCGYTTRFHNRFSKSCPQIITKTVVAIEKSKETP